MTVNQLVKSAINEAVRSAPYLSDEELTRMIDDEHERNGTRRCVCGAVARRFEVYRDDETGEVAGVVAIVNGRSCCSAFGGRKYQGTDYAALAEEFNGRLACDLAVECGAL